MKKYALLLSLLTVFISLSAQTSRTWTGSTSTDWNTAGNWSPSGVPSSTDHIVLNTASGNQPLLDASRSITNITVSAGTLNLNGYTLTVTGTTSLTGGAINNGTASFNNTTTTFAGTSFGAIVNATVSNISFNGSTFNNKVTVSKSGSGANVSNGGNTFNDSLRISLTNGFMYMSHVSNDSYNGDIVLSSTGSSTGITFGDNTGNSTLATGKTISVGGSGFSTGVLTLKRFTQSGSTAQTLTVTGSASVVFGSNSTWNGKVAVTGPGIAFSGSTFNSKVTAIKNGSSTNISNGGNTFNDTLDLSLSSGFVYMAHVNNDSYNGHVLLSSTGSSTGIAFGESTGNATLASGKTIKAGASGFSVGTLTLKRFTQTGTTDQTLTLSGSASIIFGVNATWNGKVTATAPGVAFNGSTFNNEVIAIKNGSSTSVSNGGNTFNNTLDISLSNGMMYMAHVSNDSYNGNIIVSSTGSSSGITFGESSGNSTLASGKTISVGTGGFSAGSLTLKRFTQTGSTVQSLTLTGTATFATNNTSVFNGALTVSAPNVLLASTTFNANLTVTKTGSSTNTWNSANTYNGDVSITNTGTGYINLSSVASGGDTYNGNATFTKSGTGDIILAGSASTVTFKGNVTLNNISSTQFTGSQVALFNGSTSQTLSQSGGSLNFGRLTINKSSNSLTLGTPLTVSTALTLTSGNIITTSTNLLNLADNATVSGASNSSYVQGPVSKTGNDAFTFPTGKASYYRPIGITAPSSTASIFTAEYLNSAQTISSTVDTTVHNLSTCEYWTLTRSGSTSTVNVTPSWNAASCNATTPSNMRVVGWNGTTWTSYGNGSSTGNSTAGTVTSSTNPSAYNAFTLGTKPIDFSFTLNNDTLEYGDSLTVNLTSVGIDTSQIFAIRYGSSCANVIGNDTIGCEIQFKLSDLPLTRIADDIGAFPITVKAVIGTITIEHTQNLLIVPPSVDSPTVNACELIENGCFIFNSPLSLQLFNRFSNFVSVPNNPSSNPISPWFPKPGTNNTPDYYNNQFTPQLGLTIPYVAPGFQQSPDGCGRAYVGICTFVSGETTEGNPGQRESISQNFSVIPVAGTSYTVRLQASLAGASGFSTGLAFRIIHSNGSVTTDFLYPVTGQVSPTSGFLVDTVNWAVLEGHFIATGNEAIISIGGTPEFLGQLPSTADVNSDLSIEANLIPDGHFMAYYYITDVSVSPSGINISPSGITDICDGETPITINASVVGDPDFTGFVWSSSPVDPSLIGQGEDGTITVNPFYDGETSDPTEYTYTASADVGGCVTSTSVTVYVHPAINLSLDGPANNCNAISIYTASADVTNATYTWTIPTDASYTINEAVSPLGSSIIVDWGASPLGGDVTVLVGNDYCSETQTITVAPCCSTTYTFVNPSVLDLLAVLPEEFTSIDGSGNIVINTGYTSPTSPGTEIAIIGTLTIDEDVIFQNANVIFARNAKVVFADNSPYTLYILESWLHNCDGYLWDGMYTERSNHKIYVDKSLVQDAKNAIMSKNCGDFRIINQCTFTKNFKDVVAVACKGTHPAEVYDSKFGGGAILPSTPTIVPTPTRTDANFEISKIVNIAIGKTGEAYNSFNGGNVGVRSHNSGTFLYNNRFYGYSLDNTFPLQNGIAVYASGSPKNMPSLNVIGNTTEYNLFNKCHIGILAANDIYVKVDQNLFTQGLPNSIGIAVSNNAKTNIAISNNSISEYTYGIVGVNNKRSNVKVEWNTIDLSGSSAPEWATGIAWGESYTSLTNAPANVSIEHNTITEARLGINTIGVSPIGIEANDITTVGAVYDYTYNGNTTNLNTQGINVEHSVWPLVYNNTVNGQLQNNRVENIRLAQSFLAFTMCNNCNENSSYYSGKGVLYEQSPISFFAGNQMRNHNEGLYLRNNSDIGPQGNGTAPNDNKWNGTSFTNAYIRADNTFGINSPFNVRTGAPFEAFVSNLVNLGNPVPVTNDATGTYYPCPKSFEGLSNMLRTMAPPVVEDTLTYLAFEPSMRYLNRSHLYDVVEAFADSFAVDTFLTDFAKDMSDEPFAKLGLVSKKWVLEYYSSPNSLPDTVYAARDSVEFNTPQYTRLRSKLTAARSQNNSISPTAAPDSIGKIFRGIVIDAALRYDSLLTNLETAGTDTILALVQSLHTNLYDSSQVAQLINIATLCPLVYGTDVYSARTELMGISDTLMRLFIAYTHPCESDGVSARKPNPAGGEKMANNVVFYPNPTTGDLYIVNPQDNTLQVEIVSPLGQTVYKQQLLSGTNYLNIGNLANGVYFVRVLNNRVPIVTQKLIINK